MKYDGPIVLVGYADAPTSSFPYRLNAGGIFFDQGWEVVYEYVGVGSRLSLFSALTKFSDYHAPETANSNEFFTGQHAVTINSCGVFAEYVTVTQSANKVYLGSLPN